MSHGGTRQGAGRKPKASDNEILAELIYPAISHSYHGTVEQSIHEIKDLYGVMAFKLWQSYFKLDVKGQPKGGNKGSINSKWSLIIGRDMNLLLDVLQFPSNEHLARRNYQDFLEYQSEYFAECKKLDEEFGLGPKNPRPLKYDAKIKYAAKPGRGLSNNSKGYSEMLIKVNYGFTDNLDNPVSIKDNDVPY